MQADEASVSDVTSTAPGQDGDASGTAAGMASLRVSCGVASDRALREGSGAALPLAWVRGFAAKTTDLFRAALSDVLASAAVVTMGSAGGGSITTKSPARLILAAETRAYTSAGWSVAVSPAWPVESLPPDLLQQRPPAAVLAPTSATAATGMAAKRWLQQLGSGEGYSAVGARAVASDVVRIAVRNLGVLLGEAEGVHEDTSRWAENTISWLAEQWAAGVVGAVKRKVV